MRYHLDSFFFYIYIGYGSAGVGRKVQPDLLFRIASISKTITAVGIMRLIEEGKLSLDDNVFGQHGMGIYMCSFINSETHGQCPIDTGAMHEEQEW